MLKSAQISTLSVENFQNSHMCWQIRTSGNTVERFVADEPICENQVSITPPPPGILLYYFLYHVTETFMLFSMTEQLFCISVVYSDNFLWNSIPNNFHLKLFWM